MWEIEELAGDGRIEELKVLLGINYTQLEIDVALENAIAYSRIETAKYLLALGADFSNYDYNGVYYAVHNNEIEGLKFSIFNGVDINVKQGMLLNASIITATNSKSIEIVKWLLDNGAKLRFLSKDSLEWIKIYGNEELKNLISSVGA